MFTTSYQNISSTIKTVNNHQSQLPLYEEFLGRSAKLESQLKATGLTFAAFLDTAQKIADSASKSKGSERDFQFCRIQFEPTLYS